jgi:hypothetical protein
MEDGGEGVKLKLGKRKAEMEDGEEGEEGVKLKLGKLKAEREDGENVFEMQPIFGAFLLS